MNEQWPGLWYRPGLYLSGKDRYTLQSEAGVKISFGSESLREICEKKSVATRKFGLPSAKKLVSRLADLQAASCVTDLPAGKPHPLKRDRLGSMRSGSPAVIAFASSPPMIQFPYSKRGRSTGAK